MKWQECMKFKRFRESWCNSMKFVRLLENWIQWTWVDESTWELMKVRASGRTVSTIVTLNNSHLHLAGIWTYTQDERKHEALLVTAQLTCLRASALLLIPSCLRSLTRYSALVCKCLSWGLRLPGGSIYQNAKGKKNKGVFRLPRLI